MEDRVSTGHHGFWVRMAALAAVGLLLCAFFVPPLSDGWFAVPFCFLFILTVFFVGTGLEGAICMFFRVRRTDGDNRISGKARTALLLPMGLVAVVLSYITGTVVRTWMTEHAAAVPGGYDPASAVPALLAALAGGILFLGAVLWFVPTERLLGVYGGGAILLLFLLAGILAGIRNLNDPTCAICAAGAGALLLWATNQQFLSEQCRKTKIIFVSEQARAYNSGMTGFLLPVFAVFFCLCVVGMTGVMVLFRILFFALLGGGADAGEDDSYREPEAVRQGAENFIFRQVGVGHSAVAEALFLLFLLLCAGALVVLIFRRRDPVRAFLARLLAAFYALLGFWFGRRKAYDTQSVPGISRAEAGNKEVQVFAVTAPRTAPVRTFRAFLAALHRCSDEPARLRYAYAVTVAVMRERDSSLRLSDTPRVLAAKAAGVPGSEDFANATSLFEEVAYGGSIPDEAEMKRVTETLSHLLRIWLP